MLTINEIIEKACNRAFPIIIETAERNKQKVIAREKYLKRCKRRRKNE